MSDIQFRAAFEASDFYREWAVRGMPKDKQRLAEAAWQAALASKQGEPVAWAVMDRSGKPYLVSAEKDMTCSIPLYTTQTGMTREQIAENERLREAIKQAYLEGSNDCAKALRASK